MLRVALAALLLNYAPATELCRFADPRIDESSGVSASSRRDDIFFTHNDSGDSARFFAVDRTGATVAVFDVHGARAFDWEDMARGRSHDDDEPVLFFADIGDNLRSRERVVVYEVPEPHVGHDTGSTVLRRYELRYEDGPHDAETLLVHPRDGRLYVVTKEREAPAGVYRDEAGVLTRVAEVRTDALVPGGSLYARAITSGEISPDGRRVVLRTPFQAFEWRVDTDLVEAFGGEPRRIPLPETRQGEAIAYTRDGASLLTTSEGEGAAVHLLPGSEPASPNHLLAEPLEPSPPDEEEPGMNKPVALGIAWVISWLAVRFLRGRRRQRHRPPMRHPPSA